jgi:hypothetical protein
MRGAAIAFSDRELHGFWAAGSRLDADRPVDGFCGRPRGLVRIDVASRGVIRRSTDAFFEPRRLLLAIDAFEGAGQSRDKVGDPKILVFGDLSGRVFCEAVVEVLRSARR